MLTDAEAEEDLRRLDDDPRDTNQLKKQKVQAIVRMYRRRGWVRKQATLLPPRWCRWVQSWQERAVKTPVVTLEHLQRIAKEKGASLVRDKYMHLKEEVSRTWVANWPTRVSPCDNHLPPSLKRTTFNTTFAKVLEFYRFAHRLAHCFVTACSPRPLSSIMYTIAGDARSGAARARGGGGGHQSSEQQTQRTQRTQRTSIQRHRAGRVHARGGR